MNIEVAKIGNLLYKCWPSAYRPIYRLYKRWSDSREWRLLKDAVRPGMTVVDVGANIGVFTEFLSDLVGPNGRVIALEPEPENFTRLHAAVRARRNVSAIHAAVAERSGTVSLFVSDALNVDHHSYDDGEGRRRVTVPAVALDDLFVPGERLDLIKMDIQGAEMSALLGAKRVLAENRSIELLLEFWPFGLTRAGVEPMQLLELLARLGFSVDIVGIPARSPETIGSGPGDYCNLHVHRARIGQKREKAWPVRPGP